MLCTEFVITTQIALNKSDDLFDVCVLSPANKGRQNQLEPNTYAVPCEYTDKTQPVTGTQQPNNRQLSKNDNQTARRATQMTKSETTVSSTR